MKKNSLNASAVIGSIKLLKYKYMDIYPKFNANNTLKEMGVSSHTFIAMNYFYCTTYGINIHDLKAIDILQKFSQYDVLSKFKDYNNIGKTVLGELGQNQN